MITYATLAQFRERLNIPASDTDDDTRLLRALRHATAQIDRFTARRFAPVLQTRRHDYQTPYSLRLGIDLLELLSITNGDGSVIDPAAVSLLPEGDGPKSALRLPTTMSALFLHTGDPTRAIAISGIWGTHDAWSEAWRDTTDTVQDAALTDASGTITVSDADGSDSAGESPRFQVGQLIRIEAEYLHITAVDTATNTITVIRGVRGTTAASHDQGTAIEVYVPPLDVQALTLRWATWLYQQVDAGIGAGADWLYPPDLPDDLVTFASSLRRLRVA